MAVSVSAYWRPRSIEEALALLERPGAVAIAGGTTLNDADTSEPVEVVDLQALRLGGVERTDGQALRIGATTTLQDLVECEGVPTAVREAARREQPSTLRALATVGGSIVGAGPESELLATLLVHDAAVSIVGGARVERRTLAAVLADLPLPAGRIVTAIEIDTAGVASVARTGRTPADRAIVMAAARVTATGERRLALSGVAATPILVDGTEDLAPAGDFRGSSEYRRALAAVLTARALEAIS